MNPRTPLRLLGAILIASTALVLNNGCADASDMAVSPSAAFEPTGGGSAGVTQAGAQDFGVFRSILDEGELPGPSTLDSLGFFAEHKLDYPTADCGEDVCMHGLLGVMGNMINGSNCTVVQIGLNTPIDPTTMERPPMHLVLAVDTSGSMSGGNAMGHVRAGLDRMLDHLVEGDTISLVTYDTAAEIVLENVPISELTTLKAAFAALKPAGTTNLFDGLFTAFSLARSHLDRTRQNRVIVLSDGVATAGITDAAKIASLAKGYAQQGIGVTTIGLGESFDHEMMLGLAEVGAGNFYFLDDIAAVREVFTEEIKTFLAPIALNVRIDVEIGDAYRIGRVYGTNGWTGSARDGVIEIPAIYLAGRTDASDPNETGRRGGGGGIILELIPTSAASGMGAGARIGDLTMTWTHPDAMNAPSQDAAIYTVTSESNLTSPTAPSVAPVGGWFTNTTVEKGFVMLNIFAGFEMAARLAMDGDYATARVTLTALRDAVQSWVTDNELQGDNDIPDDLVVIQQFIDNLVVAEAAQVIQMPAPEFPPNPWPSD